MRRIIKLLKSNLRPQLTPSFGKRFELEEDLRKDACMLSNLPYTGTDHVRSGVGAVIGRFEWQRSQICTCNKPHTRLCFRSAETAVQNVPKAAIQG